MATTTDQDPISRGGWRERLRRRRGLVAATVIGTAGAVAFVLWWFQPQALLFDDVVDEEFPTVGAGAEQPDDGAGSDEGADADSAEAGGAAPAGEATSDAEPMDDTEPMDDRTQGRHRADGRCSRRRSRC